VIRRALATLAGLVLGALWFLGSGLALVSRSVRSEARSGLCAPRHEDLLAALEAALVIGGTVVAVAGGLLSAYRRRPHWLLGAMVAVAVLGSCSELVLAGQAPPPR
jgi:hypothetical protein